MTASEKKQFLAQYEEIHESLMRFCIVKSRGIMDPKDLANDVLLVGLENYQKLDNKKALLSYLFTTANRICLNKIRRKKFDGRYDENAVETISDPNNSVESLVDISLLYAALDQLPLLQKEAVTLFEISDLPIKEIMVIQNSGASAVKQRIKRGREKLAELLREKDHKKTAVAVTVLFTTNSFSMSNIDAYFQAVKDLPLPMTGNEAAATITNFQFAGAATNATAAKIGSTIIKKTIIGSVLVGTVVGTAALLSSPTDAQPEYNPMTESIFSDLKSNTENDQKVFEDSKTINYERALTENQDYSNFDADFSKETFRTLVGDMSDSDTTLIVNNKISTEHSNLAPTVEAGDLLSGDTFPSAGVETVFINHLGDNVELKTWDKNEIKIIPNHVIEAKTPEDEALILENLNYKVEKQGSTLTFSPNICNVKRQKLRARKKSMSTITFANGDKAKFKVLELNYIIMLPKNCNLKLKGNYNSLIIPEMDGNLVTSLFDSHIEIGSITGKADIKLYYSSAKLGSYKNATIYLMDSDASLQSIDNLDLTAKYSTIIADKLTEAEVSLFESKLTATSFNKNLKGTIKYSTVNFEKSNIDTSDLVVYESKLTLPKINNLTIEMRYSSLISKSISTLTIPVAFESKLLLDYVENLVGVSSKYSTYKIGELANEIEMHSFEDDLIISKTGLASMTFKGKYSSYKITLAKPANYKIDFDGNYGNLDYGSLNLTIENYEKVNEHKVIKGYFQGGINAVAQLKFDCFESNVILN